MDGMVVQYVALPPDSSKAPGQSCLYKVSHVLCVIFLWVLLFPPTLLKHADMSRQMCAQ